MTFHAKLDEYMHYLGATYADLARASGLSTSALSRYRTGQREPGFDSVQMDAIVKGLTILSQETGTPFNENHIRSSLAETVRNGLDVDYDSYLRNLNSLLKSLNIRGATLSKALSYDASHISKILSGQRRPGDIGQFNEKVSSFVARRFAYSQDRPAVAELIGCPDSAIDQESKMRERIFLWLGSNMNARERNPVSSFLKTVDEFDLEQFIQTLHFQDTALTIYKSEDITVETGTDVRSVMNAELGFLRETLAGTSDEDCILYTDFPIAEMANDTQFTKQWMFGMGQLLSRGIILHIIHDVDRPFHEMMVGLESNIPLYMTGLIHPYYLPNSHDEVFNHILKVSGSAFLEGMSISGHQNNGRCILTTDPAEVIRGRAMAKQLLSKTQSLMDIYRSDRREDYLTKLDSMCDSAGTHRIIACSPPIALISEQLLQSILRRNNISKVFTDRILDYRASKNEAITRRLEKQRITLQFPELTREQFSRYPCHLALSNLFLECDIPYSYEEYQAHLEEIYAFSEQQPNLFLNPGSCPTFRNITIQILDDKCAIVSKEKSPTIHFMIYHPRMVHAIDNFVPPIMD